MVPKTQMHPYFYTIQVLGPDYYDMCPRNNSQGQYEYELRFDSRVVRGQSRIISLMFCVITFEKGRIGI